MRGTFVYRDGHLIEKHLARPLIQRGPRSELPTPSASVTLTNYSAVLSPAATNFPTEHTVKVSCVAY